MCRQSLELSSSSQTAPTALKSDPSLQMNPNTQCGMDLPSGTDKVKPNKGRKLLPHPQCSIVPDSSPLPDSHRHRELPLFKLMRQELY